jgi:hypothetical protein
MRREEAEIVGDERHDLPFLHRGVVRIPVEKSGVRNNCQAVQLRTVSIRVWAGVHFIGIAAWLRVASPLWHITREQRCPDFGDSLYLLVWVLPSLALGVIAAVWGLAYTCLKSRHSDRHKRILLWCSMVIAWCLAAGVAYLMIRQDLSLSC